MLTQNKVRLIVPLLCLTPVAGSKGFAPEWNQKFSFNIRMSEAALLLIMIYDKESLLATKVRVAYYCLPVT